MSVGYDTSLYTGPALAPGWPESYVTTGNVTPIVSLEVDQGRLTAAGTPEDSDDPDNLRPRATDPAGMAAASFAALLAADGIRVTGSPVAQAAARARRGRSPACPRRRCRPSCEQMLEESNNVIAENLARQVALATGQPASFSGAAAAVVAELRRLGVSTGLQPGGRQRPVPAGRDRAGHAGQGGRARHRRRRGCAPLLAGLPVAGLFRHAVGRAERVQRDRRRGPRLGPGQDRQPRHGDGPGRTGHRQERRRRWFSPSWPTRSRPPGMLQAAANAIDEAAAALADCGCR